MAPHVLSDMVRSTIPQFFSGKNVFVTGFTGFLGKYLVQKMLSDIPDIGTIYVLIRESKGKTVEEKLAKVLENPLFEHLRREGKVLDKIVPIKGDLYDLNLGISDDSRQELINKVNTVYHSAATVRFDMPLSDAILLNVRGTREVCNLAMEMKNCDAFMHVSSTYCQIIHGTVEEKLYPSPVTWKEAIELAENVDKFELSIMCRKYTEGFPNTYTFSKAIAESVVEEICGGGKMKTVIFRPSIVTSAERGIIPGWTDNYNGPVGLLVAAAKGIIRSIYLNIDIQIDTISVDVVINYMLKATWMQQFLNSTDISVYNCSSLEVNKISTHAYYRHGFAALEDSPLDPVWHINPVKTQNKNIYLMNIFFFHFMPAYFIDLFLRFMGKPEIVSKLERKVYIAMIALEYFMHNDFIFENDKCIELDDHLEDDDKEIFYGSTEIDLTEYLKANSFYVKKHMLNESVSEENCRWFQKKRVIFAVLHLTIKYTVLFMVLCWSWNHIFVHVFNNIYDYLEKL